MKTYDAPVADADVSDILAVEESNDTTTREDRFSTWKNIKIDRSEVVKNGIALALPTPGVLKSY